MRGIKRDSPTSEYKFKDYPIDPNEIDGELTQDEVGYIEGLQSAWQEFLLKNPETLSREYRASRIDALQTKIKAKEVAKNKAGSELQRQYDFFMESREALEETYATEVLFAQNLQKVIHERLERQLDEVKSSHSTADRLITWDNFVEKVNINADILEESTQKISGPTEPSPRALALIDPEGDSEDVMLRALQMDHALLSTEREILRKELERIESTNNNFEFIGKFFTDINIWGILMKQREKEECTKLKRTPEEYTETSFPKDRVITLEAITIDLDTNKQQQIVKEHLMQKKSSEIARGEKATPVTNVREKVTNKDNVLNMSVTKGRATKEETTKEPTKFRHDGIQGVEEQKAWN